MKLKDYSWNEHERQLKKEKKIVIPSKPKIRIWDDQAGRQKLEFLLEQLPHAVLADWALANAKPFLNHLDSSLQEDPRITEAEQALIKRIKGNSTAFELRQAGFAANQLAKEAKTDISRYSARVFAQAIAVGHMRGHAIVSSDYAVKVIQLLFPENYDKVKKEREKQVRSAENYLDFLDQKLSSADQTP